MPDDDRMKTAAQSARIVAFRSLTGEMLDKARHRLGVVSYVFLWFLLWMAGIAIVLTKLAHVGTDFPLFWEQAGVVGLGVLACLAMYVLTRAQRIGSLPVMRIGIGYHVLMSLLISIAEDRKSVV